MSMNRGKRQKHKSNKTKPSVGDTAREALEQIDEDNRVLQLFKECSLELTDKHDRYERIVKISRDITIESKRIIFLLHNSNLDIDSDKKLEVLQEAETRLNNLVEKNFKAIAIELEEHDPYLYLRAYTSGLQEFVEALLFFWYLKADLMKTWSEINETFVYKRDDEQQDKKSVMLLFPEVEFILGIGDFTGELMRKCINSLGTGNIEDCFKICNFVKDLYTGFLGVNNIGYKEFNHKMYVLKQSVMKMELVCYNIRVRGSEVPKHMLVNVLSSGNKEHDEDDEGFF